MSTETWAVISHTSQDQERPGGGRAQQVVGDALVLPRIPRLHALQLQAPVRQGPESPAGSQGLPRTQPLNGGRRLSSGPAPQSHILTRPHCDVLGLYLEHRGTCGRWAALKDPELLLSTHSDASDCTARRRKPR